MTYPINESLQTFSRQTWGLLHMESDQTRSVSPVCVGGWIWTGWGPPGSCPLVEYSALKWQWQAWSGPSSNNPSQTNCSHWTGNQWHSPEKGLSCSLTYDHFQILSMLQLISLLVYLFFVTILSLSFIENLLIRRWFIRYLYHAIINTRF